MNLHKFARLVVEFPYISYVLHSERLTADHIQAILVRQADRNLLEVRPGGWKYDAGSFASVGYRHFWIVSGDQIIRLKNAAYKDVAYQGGGYVERAGLIREQFAEYRNHQIIHMIEVTWEGYDFDEGDDTKPTVIVYKMDAVDWRHFCRSVAVDQTV